LCSLFQREVAFEEQTALALIVRAAKLLHILAMEDIEHGLHGLDGVGIRHSDNRIQPANPFLWRPWLPSIGIRGPGILRVANLRLHQQWQPDVRGFAYRNTEKTRLGHTNDAEVSAI
jgi:hypothetical protein